MTYLPKHATIDQACEWLSLKTGEHWLLSRLLECGLTPRFWLEYKAGYPAIFGDNIEGYLTRMVFAGDVCRLEADGGDALVNMFAAHNDVEIIKVEPGIVVPLSELRFKRSEIEALATLMSAAPLLSPRSSLTSKTPKGSRAYTSLHELVQPYLNCSYDELPEEIASRVASDFYPHSWQRSTPTERFTLSLERDKELDPALSEHAYWFDLQSQIVEAERRIANSAPGGNQSMADDGSPIEETLRSLKFDIDILHAKWHRPNFMSGSAQQIALEKHKRAGNSGIVEMPDALQFLSQNTGALWTDTQLFSFAAKCHIGLYAVVPPWTPIEIIRHNADGFFSRPYIEPGRTLMAELGYAQVEALWITGVADASTACYAPPPNSGDLISFAEPVRVHRCDVRLTSELVLKILREWEGLRRIGLPTEQVGQTRASVQEPAVAAPHASQQTLVASPTVKAAWIIEARTLATKYISAWRAAGNTPTVADAALYVEGVFSTEGVLNTREEAIDRETIKREALRGITDRKPGERIGGAKIPSEKRHRLP